MPNIDESSYTPYLIAPTAISVAAKPIQSLAKMTNGGGGGQEGAWWKGEWVRSWSG